VEDVEEAEAVVVESDWRRHSSSERLSRRSGNSKLYGDGYLYISTVNSSVYLRPSNSLFLSCQLISYKPR